MRTSGGFEEEASAATEILLEARQQHVLHLGHVYGAFRCITGSGGPTPEAARRFADVLGVVPLHYVEDLVDQLQRQIVSEAGSLAFNLQREVRRRAQPDGSDQSNPLSQPTLADIRRKGDNWYSSAESALLASACVLQALEWSVARPNGPIVTY